MDEADIVIAHNGDRFDIKRMNSFFLKNGLLPPSPYATVDTLKVARGAFGFISNKLDALGKELQLGRKVVHSGFKLWRDCMKGDKKAFATMLRYNKQDVILLEELYLKIKPYAKSHPNMALYTPNPDGKCPKCSSKKMWKDGKRYTKSGVYQLWECQDCGYYAKSNVRLDKTSLS